MIASRKSRGYTRDITLKFVYVYSMCITLKFHVQSISLSSCQVESKYHLQLKLVSGKVPESHVHPGLLSLLPNDDNEQADNTRILQ